VKWWLIGQWSDDIDYFALAFAWFFVLLPVLIGVSVSLRFYFIFRS
jgi:hypothetical protein